MEKWDWNAISQITQHLYLSAVTALNDQKLDELGITLIINASKELPMFPTKDPKIHNVRVPVYDSIDQDLAPYFEVMFTTLAQCLKITQIVAFEFLNFGIFHQFLSY